MCRLSTVLKALLLVDLGPDVDLAALPVDPDLGLLDHGALSEDKENLNLKHDSKLGKRSSLKSLKMSLSFG